MSDHKRRPNARAHVLSYWKHIALRMLWSPLVHIFESITSRFATLGKTVAIWPRIANAIQEVFFAWGWDITGSESSSEGENSQTNS